jgi:UDP-N-acetylmuramate dehydrogenase
MKIKKNVSLAQYTTFRIGGRAEYFAEITSRDEVLEAISFAKLKKLPIFVLGGGSNLLLTGDIRGLVLRNRIVGSAIIKETKSSAFVTANSGEDWTRLVEFSVDKGLYGLENLYLIPGTVGAAPVQNIGAYGSEVKDCLFNLVAIDLKTGRETVFSVDDCRFGYRQSIFKGRLKGKYFIYQVTFLLSKKPKLKLDYGNIKEELSKKKKKSWSASDVAAAVGNIRRNKLPDVSELASAGSFFKNPEITSRSFSSLAKKFPDIKGFPAANGMVKVPAGWLIERTGWKGRRFGKAGIYEKQALIVVSYGGRSAKDVIRLVEKIKGAVYDMFKIRLEEEVNII